jgi:hypothetical protein
MPDKPAMPDYAAAAGWLATRRKPLLVSHRRPDGDALGAIAGLSRLLKQRGATPAALLFEPFPERYAFMRADAEWRELPRGATPAEALTRSRRWSLITTAPETRSVRAPMICA